MRRDVAVVEDSSHGRGFRHCGAMTTKRLRMCSTNALFAAFLNIIWPKRPTTVQVYGPHCTTFACYSKQISPVQRSNSALKNMYTRLSAPLPPRAQLFQSKTKSNGILSSLHSPHYQQPEAFWLMPMLSNEIYQHVSAIRPTTFQNHLWRSVKANNFHHNQRC